MLSEEVAPTDVVQDLLLVLRMFWVFLCLRLFSTIVLARCVTLICSCYCICGDLSVFHCETDLKSFRQILLIFLSEQLEEVVLGHDFEKLAHLLPVLIPVHVLLDHL